MLTAFLRLFKKLGATKYNRKYFRKKILDKPLRVIYYAYITRNEAE
jgi:hypothetical protein